MSSVDMIGRAESGPECPASFEATVGAPQERREQTAVRDVVVDYGSRSIVHLPPWGGLTVADVLLNNLALGLFLVTVFCAGFRPELFLSAAFPALLAAWGLLVLDLGLLILDLGDPGRFHHMLRTVRPSSPMWIGVWALALSGLFMTFPALWSALHLLERIDLLPDAFAARLGAPVMWGVVLAALACVPCAAVGLLYKGVLFSATSRPMWKNARWFPAYLANGSLLMGTAVLAGIGAWTLPPQGTRLLGDILLILLVTDMLLLELHLCPLLESSGRGMRRVLMHSAALFDAIAFLCLLAAAISAFPAADSALLYCGLAGALLSAFIARACFIKNL